MSGEMTAMYITVLGVPRSNVTNGSNMQANNRNHFLELVTALGYDADMNNNHKKHDTCASLNAVQIF